MPDGWSAELMVVGFCPDQLGFGHWTEFSADDVGQQTETESGASWVPNQVNRHR